MFIHLSKSVRVFLFLATLFLKNPLLCADPSLLSTEEASHRLAQFLEQNPSIDELRIGSTQKDLNKISYQTPFNGKKTVCIDLEPAADICANGLYPKLYQHISDDRLTKIALDRICPSGIPIDWFQYLFLDQICLKTNIGHSPYEENTTIRKAFEKGPLVCLSEYFCHYSNGDPCNDFFKVCFQKLKPGGSLEIRTRATPASATTNLHLSFIEAQNKQFFENRVIPGSQEVINAFAGMLKPESGGLEFYFNPVMAFYITYPLTVDIRNLIFPLIRHASAAIWEKPNEYYKVILIKRLEGMNKFQEVVTTILSSAGFINIHIEPEIFNIATSLLGNVQCKAYVIRAHKPADSTIR